MAESIAFNMVEKLMGWLGSLALGAWNVKSDLEKLKNTMLTIQAVLLDAEEQQDSNHQVKDWLDKLKDALDDADNLLDDFSTEDLRQEVNTRDKKAKKVRISFPSSIPLVFSFKMVGRIKEIREKLEAIDDDRKKFHFTSRTFEPRVVQRKRETHSFIPEEDVVGRDAEKKVLLEFLLNTDMNMKENVSIASIIGFGGLGKTALAQLVYNDKAVQGHFEMRKWVCVSDDFDVKAIATNIIGSKTNDVMDQVQQQLRKEIEGRRYLLVLDDIWNEDRELWLQLMTLLKNGGKGSKIIITTRSEKVAKITSTSSRFFLKSLDEEQSWRLFTQLAFENGKEPENQNLTEIGKEIVRKCAGVPLAIRSIGSLMYSKESEEDWLSFKDKDLVKIDEQSDNRVLQLIKLSYDHLPFYLKRCFSFCSLFPKDYYISRPMLIQLWVAQGFIQSSDDSMCLEDVGNEYFMNLAHRSFFQDFHRDELSGGIRVCKMHDLVHDLAKFVAGNDCVIVNENGQHIDERTRHLSFGFRLDSSWQVPGSFLKAYKLRTFLLSPAVYESLGESACKLIMSSFEQLRALDLNNLNAKTLPTCIGTLTHLRYLDLSWNRHIEVLPKSITKLHNLQTLKLKYCSMLRELPRDLWRLIRLRHLDLDGCHKLTYMPCGIGQLTNLQTLSLFVLDTSSRYSGGASELRGLNDLRGSLVIKGLECLRQDTTDVKDINLMEKWYLKELTLTWDTQTTADDSEVAKDDIILQGLRPHHDIKCFRIVGFSGLVISNWVCSFRHLLRISIEDCTRLQNLPQLHLLLQLKRLVLSNLPSLEWIDKKDNEDSLPTTFFPSLEDLFLSELPKLRGWWRCSEEGMLGGRCLQLDRLVELHIFSCPNLIFKPLHPNVIDVLVEKVSEKILRQTVSHSSTPLLCNSTIQYCSQAVKLERLEITEINDLKSLSGVLQHLTALRHLVIDNCKELDPCNDHDGSYRMQWEKLQNLHSLSLRVIPKMESLPEGLQHVTTVSEIAIAYCYNLTYLPEWIASLGQSLQHITIARCPKLTSLPEGMRHLTSLQKLRIIDCPQLEERCRREVGEDWPKISHVPNIHTSF